MRGIAFLAGAAASILACSPSSKAVQPPASSPAPSAPSSEIAPARQMYTVVIPTTHDDSIAAVLAWRRRRAVDSLTTKNLIQFRHTTNPPDSATYDFYVIRDAKGRIAAVAELPVSQSGDWNLQSIHYFDTTGTTVVVSRTASFFNGCTLANTDSTIGIREMVTSYFAPRHRLVKRTFVRTTFNDSTPAPTENCNESFQTAYPIYPNWDSLAVATGLGAALRRVRH